MAEKARQRDSINRLSALNANIPSRRASSRLSDVGYHVADGFRPICPGPSFPAHSPEPSRPLPQRSFTDSLTVRSSTLPGDNRRSIRKSQHEEEVDAAGLAASLGLRTSSPASASGIDRSSSSASSSSQLERTQSTYLSRVASFSFSYPRRPPSAANNPLRPAHPYALYQQTTYEEPEELEQPDPNRQTITIGFPGHGANYQRRTGPDGEELEVVGPDGHTEDLPPYTRYPIQGPYGDKPSPQASVDSVSPVSSVGSPAASESPSSSTISRPAMVHSHSGSVHATDNVMGMGQPVPQPRSPTIHDISPMEMHDLRGSSMSSIIQEKPRNKKSWKDRGNKKVICGLVPLWALLLFAILCVFMAIVAGGVIGGLLSGQRDKRDK
jgi:hypothetical protein